MGGILFGGPMGALAAGVTSLFEEASGDSIGDYLASLVDDVFGGEEAVPENSAQNAPATKKGRNLGRSVTRSASVAALNSALGMLRWASLSSNATQSGGSRLEICSVACLCRPADRLPGKRQSRPLPAPWPYRSEALPTRARIRRPGTQTLRAWTTPLR